MMVKIRTKKGKKYPIQEKKEGRLYQELFPKGGHYDTMFGPGRVKQEATETVRKKKALKKSRRLRKKNPYHTDILEGDPIGDVL
jgi:hypothetical protein